MTPRVPRRRSTGPVRPPVRPRPPLIRPRVAPVAAPVMPAAPAETHHGKLLVEKPVITKYPDQRVGIFVDVSNMYWAVRRMGGSLNFRNMREAAVGNRKLIRALAYAVSSGAPDEQKFFDAVSKAGFEVKLKELQVFFGGKKKADWDVGLAMDMVRLAPLIDVAVLVSGDGDYVPVVEFLQNSGHLVEVMAFKEGVSAKLVERADAFIDMGKETRRFLIR
jgi:uncharacterized LabA/DUF88 family protein